MTTPLEIAVDVALGGDQSIYLFTPVSDRAKEHFERMMPDDAVMLGEATAVESRYAEDIITDLVGPHGFVVRNQHGVFICMNEDYELFPSMEWKAPPEHEDIEPEDFAAVHGDVWSEDDLLDRRMDAARASGREGAGEAVVQDMFPPCP